MSMTDMSRWEEVLFHVTSSRAYLEGAIIAQGKTAASALELQRIMAPAGSAWQVGQEYAWSKRVVERLEAAKTEPIPSRHPDRRPSNFHCSICGEEVSTSEQAEMYDPEAKSSSVFCHAECGLQSMLEVS